MSVLTSSRPPPLRGNDDRSRSGLFDRLSSVVCLSMVSFKRAEEKEGEHGGVTVCGAKEKLRGPKPAELEGGTMAY